MINFGEMTVIITIENITVDLSRKRILGGIYWEVGGDHISLFQWPIQMTEKYFQAFLIFSRRTAVRPLA